MFLNYLTKWKNTYCKNCINEKVSHDMRGENRKQRKDEITYIKVFCCCFFLVLTCANNLHEK